jgi:hypothetical protein
MKPRLRSILSTFVSSAICTGVGIAVGAWIATPRVSNIDAPCADTPLACAKRTAENRCGGPGTYQLVGADKSSKLPKFVFVCVDTEPV